MSELDKFKQDVINLDPNVVVVPEMDGFACYLTIEVTKEMKVRLNTFSQEDQDDYFDWESDLLYRIKTEGKNGWHV